MIETSVPPFKITLPVIPGVPEEETYQKLNEAHEADKEDEGNREETLYSTEQSHKDNIESYVRDLTLADTRELVNQLKNRLQTLKGNEASEFDIRTGNNEDAKKNINEGIAEKEEAFKNEQTARYLRIINTFTDTNGIDFWLESAKESFAKGEITEPQLKEIQSAVETKFKNEQAARYLRIIDTFTDTNGIDFWLESAKESFAKGEITEPQLKEIQSAVENKFKNEQTARYLRIINTFTDTNGIDIWLESAKESFAKGEITEPQLKEIQSAVENKKASFN